MSSDSLHFLLCNSRSIENLKRTVKIDVEIRRPCFERAFLEPQKPQVLQRGDDHRR